MSKVNLEVEFPRDQDSHLSLLSARLLTFLNFQDFFFGI